MTNNCQRTRCQEERSRPTEQKAQRIATSDNLVFVPGISKLFAPLLAGSYQVPRGFACTLLIVWIHFLYQDSPPSSTCKRCSLADPRNRQLNYRSRPGDKTACAGSGSGVRGVQGCGGASRWGMPAVSASTQRSALRVAVTSGNSVSLPRLASSTNASRSNASSSP